MGSKGTLPFCLNIHENVLVFLTFFFNLKRKFPTALETEGNHLRELHNNKTNQGTSVNKQY
jgi:hypothetical protein